MLTPSKRKEGEDHQTALDGDAVDHLRAGLEDAIDLGERRGLLGGLEVFEDADEQDGIESVVSVRKLCDVAGAGDRGGCVVGGEDLFHRRDVGGEVDAVDFFVLRREVEEAQAGAEADFEDFFAAGAFFEAHFDAAAVEGAEEAGL